MTYAPGDLQEVQAYARQVTGLPWVSLGIIHGTPQGGGYHEGNDLLAQAGRLDSDYSKRESSRDRPGSNGGSAFDQGEFDVTYKGNRRTLDGWNRHLIAACQAGAYWTRDVREVIYRDWNNHDIIRRWDRLGRRTTGDSSHGTHTHVSFFRDSEGRRDDNDNYLGGFMAYMEPALIKPPEPEPEDEMGPVAYPVPMPERVGEHVEVTVPPSNLGNFTGLNAYFKVGIDSYYGAVRYRLAGQDNTGAWHDLSPTWDPTWGEFTLDAEHPTWGRGSLPTGLTKLSIERKPTPGWTPPADDPEAEEPPRRLVACMEYGEHA